MQTLPKFRTLPDGMKSLLKNISTEWAKTPIRPRFQKEVSSYWTNIINEWVETKDLPLYIRKFNRDESRGKLLLHKKSGRKLIPTDNSPANWSFIEAYSEKVFTIDEIRELIKEDKIPIAMALKKEEKKECNFKCLRKDILSPNEFGWKICHKKSIGLNKRGSITDIPLEDLKAHFRDFLSPANIFLIPKSLSGLGELPELTELMKDYL